MIKVKSLFDAVEADDGARIWVEPTGLTRDLREWCNVGLLMPQLAPPHTLRHWFEHHPDGYDYFRGLYHAALQRSEFKGTLADLAKAARESNITLLRVGDDPEHNCAAALQEFINELSAYPHSEG